MGDEQEAISVFTDRLRTELERVYKAGYNRGLEDGRKLTHDALKRSLEQIGFHVQAPDIDPLPTAATVIDGTPNKDEDPERLPSGTVKPVVLQLIRDNPQGLRSADITKATGFKHNTVRGTVWDLNKRGLVYGDNGRWFAVQSPRPPEEGSAADPGKPDDEDLSQFY